MRSSPVSRYRKFIVALCTALSSTLILLTSRHVTAQILITIFLSLAGSYGVYQVPNTPTPTPKAE